MKTSEFNTIWKQQEPFIQAIVELFHPFVEVAVHNLKEGKIAALYNCISQRKVGDNSPLQELKVKTENFPDHFSPYYKQNWDGTALKCTTITLRSSKGTPVGLICINMDVSTFQEGFRLLQRFLTTKEEAKNPVEIFGAHCEEQVDCIVESYLDEHRLNISRLNRTQKREVVQRLYEKGVFNYKNAANCIAKKLKTSRATVYNHIKTFSSLTP
jgi:predicted transcriptional regulator YheO